jgi:hypothetical protein
MSEAADLYETDFYLWTQQQAAAIRAAAAARTNLPVDWEHVAEEIESLGGRDRRELESRIGTIIEHLLKLKISPAAEPRRGWIETIARSRAEIARILKASPSLRAQLDAMVAEEMAEAARLVIGLLRDWGELTPELAGRVRETSFTSQQVLGDWLPESWQQ